MKANSVFLPSAKEQHLKWAKLKWPVLRFLRSFKKVFQSLGGVVEKIFDLFFVPVELVRRISPGKTLRRVEWEKRDYTPPMRWF